ncbi:HNH endonuclease [Prevotella sp. E15-22]|uniref:HNH endonuclease n=1 Tax=Prevotella sp. E15-22 TaxID=2937774 RepID=UPI00204FDBD8|nr:HNH endonuclease [Prevotella sp. E15-22]UPS45356.1 HNH endonuclease [Prevotella sp. E15-22]
MDIGNIATAQLFTKLITGNPNTEKINYLQTASQELKDRLPMLDVIGERAYELRKFFNGIPTGQHFLILPERIEDRIQMYLYTKLLSEIDKVSLQTTDLEKIASYLYDHYEVRTFNGDERLNIGVFDRKKRVCRFCGRSMPDVKFTQKAHAISESLGNKGLVCREECDECNARFNQTIEQDITRLLQFFLILKGIKGKNGNPTLQGDGISIKNDPSSQATLGRSTLVLKVPTMPDTHDPQEIVQHFSGSFAGFSSVKYIPQNIYKCFCKYVLSVIDSKFLPYFKGTIDWINEAPTHHRLPPVWHYTVPNSTDSPYLIVMQRKHKHKNFPYCWAILSIAGDQYLFIIPFCSLDKYKFVGNSRVEFFHQWLKNAMPNINLQPMKLHGIAPTSLKINANFNISPDCVEGRDYYFIKPQKPSK